MLKIINAIKSLFAKRAKPSVSPKDLPKEIDPFQQKQTDEIPITMYIADSNTSDVKELMYDDALHYLEGGGYHGYQDITKFQEARDIILGRNEQDRKIASDFFIDNLDQINYLDKIFMDYHVNKQNPHEALKALYKIKEFCFRHGNPGQIYYKHTYEQLFNSKDFCFSFEEVILQTIKDKADFELIYVNILQLINDHGSMLQKDLYALFSEKKSIAMAVVKKLHSSGKITKEKKGNSYILQINKNNYNVTEENL